MKVLIAIIGAHSQPEHRQAQRETWLQDLPAGADYCFFLGGPIQDEPDVEYGDFQDGPIRAGGYGWHTRVLRDKVQMLVEYALDRGYDSVFKCDDDTYCRVTKLLTSGFEQHDYTGFTEPHTAHGVPYRFALGSGYWLSRFAMSLIAEHGLYLHDAEDYAVGQLLAAHDIHPHHDARYVPQILRHAHPEQLTADPSVLTMHKVAPGLMRELYRADLISQ